jgi:hypothetical protein
MDTATGLMRAQLHADAAILIGDIKSDFERTRDSVYVWQAIRVCAVYGSPSPLWVRAYLNDVAIGLLGLDNSGKSFYQDVTHTLGITQLAVNKAKKLTRDRSIFLAITEMRMAGVTLENSITEVAGQFYLAESTVSGIHKEQQKILKEEKNSYLSNPISQEG